MEWQGKDTRQLPVIFNSGSSVLAPFGMAPLCKRKQQRPESVRLIFHRSLHHDTLQKCHLDKAIKPGNMNGL